MLKDLNIKKISIFRALQLGDLLCAIPALRAIRHYFPEAHITLIGLPWAQDLVHRFPKYFDAFLIFPGYPGLPEQPYDADRYQLFLTKVQTLKFDLVFQLQGNGTVVNQMIRTFGAAHIAGYMPGPQSLQPNELMMIYPNEGHEVLRHLKLMAFLGIPDQGPQLEFPLYDHDIREFNALRLPLHAGKYICIHPGSRGNWRQWPPLYFARLGDYCTKMDYQVVITGTREELPIVNEVVGLMKVPPLVAAGKTSLGAAAVLIDQAFALISNCTGVSHLASALQTQSVVISMDGEPERWAPMDQERHVTVDWTKNSDFHEVMKEVTALFFRL